MASCCNADAKMKQYLQTLELVVIFPVYSCLVLNWGRRVGSTGSTGTHVISKVVSVSLGGNEVGLD